MIITQHTSLCLIPMGLILSGPDLPSAWLGLAHTGEPYWPAGFKRAIYLIVLLFSTSEAGTPTKINLALYMHAGRA